MKSHKFKPGDKVKDRYGNVGTVIQVYELLPNGVRGSDVVRVIDAGGFDYLHESNFLELATEKENTVNTTKKPNKHRDLIIAWANGSEIEYLDVNGNWKPTDTPEWYRQVEYRIKPVPKPDQVRTMFVELYPKLDNAYNKPNIKLTFDGETEKLKAVEIIDND